MNTTAVKTTKWTIDPTHSELTFKVKHLMITHVKGAFNDFDAVIHGEGEDFGHARVTAIVDAGSINTNNGDRDTHLKSVDFFDVENHKQITFKGTEFIKLDDHNYQLKGILEIKGISNKVILDVEFGGFVKDPFGNEKAGFSINGKINRKDWGLNWNAALETGGVMVSEEVRIQGELQFVKQA